MNGYDKCKDCNFYGKWESEECRGFYVVNPETTMKEAMTSCMTGAWVDSGDDNKKCITTSNTEKRWRFTECTNVCNARPADDQAEKMEGGNEGTLAPSARTLCDDIET